ncbi:hypothetical protein SDRG_14861 [Saprolegnia diclina VS20]|uniref:AAA+ ATPase domain-containing protein n=1 Tax=Saprolegnia diclina (strain VS20) TaxID=1156394 RepID=T0RCM4_SAPDV|nr:hypothetical protein SDRG_14861 [Saprolegnia diclina VS20]EQC27337.1 hypothetical protein SDRG_14861 [Saprolegnia diclina VS20]|eukprot:XP_008619241.1 hypothetical protein SDRG_14861 [Saprolegnia diclina VS20]
MAVLDDIRDLLQAICEAPTQLPSLDEYQAFLDEWRQQASAVLTTLDQQSETETMRSDLMSDTMSMFSLDPSSLASTTDAAAITHLDIAVLHASPFLLRLPDNRLLPLPELNIRHEQRSLHKIFHESKRALRTMQGVMTVDSLREVLDRDVQVLHFSGHGGVVASGPDALVFEDPHATGLGQLVDAHHLSSILRAGCASTSVKLVFVSSCHSADVGRVFISAGVEHVVCARQDERVLDETSILFAQSFYHALVYGKTVPQAFEIAQTRVRAEAADESDKFLLLQSPKVHAACGLAEYAHCACVSSPLFSEIPIGPYVTLTQHLHHASRPSSSSLPPMPSVFLGREMELHALCSALPSQRLLTIRGSPGIGKSTCALKVAHYLAERHVYEHGVFFVSARGVQSVESLEASIRSAVLADDAASSMVHAPLSSFLHHVLLVLDNMEDPYQANGAAVQTFLRSLLDSCPQLRLIVTSRLAMQMPDEKIMSLNRLSSVHAVRLFVKKAPRRLQEATDYCAAPGALEDQLRDHPLLAFLDGHPQAISLCASLLLDKTLPELTQAMVAPDASASLPPLMASLTVSVASLPSDDVRKFFALQGLFPGGGLAMDYKAMLGADFEAHASLLVRFSLLQKQYPQAKVVRDPIMLSAWTHYSGYVGGRDKFTSVHRSRKANQEEKVQTTVSQATMLSLSTIYSTFPFISSFARLWLSNEPVIGQSLEKLSAKHFQKSIRWIYRYIGTFGPFSSAAYVLFDIQEPNLWMCLERFLEKHQDAATDSKRELVALPGASDMDVNSSEDAPSSSYTHTVTTTTDDPSAELSSESSDKTTEPKKVVRKKHRKSDPKLALVVADMACHFAHTLYLAGRHDGATRAATLGIGLCKQYGFRGVEANLRKLMGVILINEKKLDDAKAQFGIALILYKSTVSKIGHATAMTGIGLVHSRQGNLRGAHSCFAKALTMYEWSHHVVGQLNCHQRLGHLEKKLKLGEESDVTQHYAASRRLQGDLNLHRKEDQDGLRWVGHEMSLLLEIADTHVASTKKSNQARYTKALASSTSTVAPTVESSDESSFAKRKTYDSSRRRSSGNQKHLFPDPTPVP